MQPHRRQPTRLHRPWDSPGKNTGVGCHFLLQCMKVKSESEVAQSCLTLRDPMDCSPPGSFAHEIFGHCLLQESMLFDQNPGEWCNSEFSKGKTNKNICKYKAAYSTLTLRHKVLLSFNKEGKNDCACLEYFLEREGSFLQCISWALTKLIFLLENLFAKL